jgi:hypothetical protein
MKHECSCIKVTWRSPKSGVFWLVQSFIVEESCTKVSFRSKVKFGWWIFGSKVNSAHQHFGPEFDSSNTTSRQLSDNVYYITHRKLHGNTLSGIILGIKHADRQILPPKNTNCSMSFFPEEHRMISKIWARNTEMLLWKCWSVTWR